MIDLLILVAGITLLVTGGDILVRGASGLAAKFGISSLVIGMTVVAFGTSAPELAVNITAAVKGSPGLSFGNIIGSNIANIGLILGCAALIKPMYVQRPVIIREIPMMLLATVATMVMAFDLCLNSRPNVIDRADGIGLLLLFGVFMYYTTVDVIRQRNSNHDETPKADKGFTTYSIMTVGGMIMLILGGRWTVDAAVNIAHSIGISEAIIGLTIVAIGTSLPELVTAVVASLRGESDLAIGNVVGSNIFNLLLVCGVTSVVSPITIPEGGLRDLVVLSLLSLILMPFAITHQRRLTRAEGAFLVITYAVFIVSRTLV